MSPGPRAGTRAVEAVTAQRDPRSESSDLVDMTMLERRLPESEGVESGALEALVAALDDGDLGMHSLMVVRHGQVIAEGWWSPYDAVTAHMMFSVSKSLTATAVGIAEAEGLLSVEEPILNFFPTYATAAVTRNVAGLQLRHVLSMATGHSVDTMPMMRALPGDDWVRIFFEVPLEYPPGTHFVYNSGASFVLSAVIASRTGQSVRDYLTPRLFEPLGIAVPPWETNSRGICLGASGLRLRTEDMAKIGLLYLRRGVWGTRRLLTEEWIDKATSVQVDNGPSDEADWSQGYGFQFWRSQYDSYRADGRYGQFILILPAQDLVVAITAGTSRSREISAMVWEHLLPGVHDDLLPPDDGAQRRLQDRLAHLAAPVPGSLDVDPPSAELVNGRTFALSFNTLGLEAVMLSFHESQITMSLLDVYGRTESAEVGRHRWLPGRSGHWPYEEMQEVLVASRGGWIDDHTLEIRQRCIETPFTRVWRYTVTGHGMLRVRVGLDLGFWESLTEELVGREYSGSLDPRPSLMVDFYRARLTP